MGKKKHKTFPDDRDTFVHSLLSATAQDSFYERERMERWSVDKKHYSGNPLLPSTAHCVDKLVNLF
jgi:hypothetical protein